MRPLPCVFASSYAMTMEDLRAEAGAPRSRLTFFAALEGSLHALVHWEERQVGSFDSAREVVRGIGPAEGCKSIRSVKQCSIYLLQKLQNDG